MFLLIIFYILILSFGLDFKPPKDLNNVCISVFSTLMSTQEITILFACLLIFGGDIHANIYISHLRPLGFLPSKQDILNYQ